MEVKNLSVVRKSDRIAKRDYPFTPISKTKNAKKIRVTKKAVVENNKTNKKNSIANMADVQQQREELERQRRELEQMQARIAAQQAELNNSRAALEEQNRQATQAQQELAAQRAEIERARIGQNPVQANAIQQVNQNALDLGVIIGNVQTMHLDIKVPEFRDEKTTNPLQFLEDAERFFKIKNIINDQNKLNVINVLLHGKARAWLELNNGFQSFALFRENFEREFYSIPTQVKIKSLWANRKFNNQEGNLQTFFINN